MSSDAAPETISKDRDARLAGHWLVAARAAWLALVLFILAVFIGGLPDSIATLHQPCVGDWCVQGISQLPLSDLQALPQHGLSLDAYAWSWLALNAGTALIWILIGGILFWRKSDDWLALLVALMLVSSGANSVTTILLYSSSGWRIPENAVQLVVGVSTLLTLALFPSGRFVPRGTLWIALLNPAYLVVYLLFLRQLRIPGWAMFSNPVNAATWFVSWIVLAGAQLYRYRRVSDAVQRQQTKWVAYSFFTAMVVGFLGQLTLEDVLPNVQNGILYVLLSNNFSLVSLLVPLSLGVAMFRYRLWDIDVIVNRTLVYGILTAALLLIYLGLVLGLQSLVRLFTGSISQQPIVIVASTLAIAALFQPLRQGIQRFIDRRFYRSKYDSTKILSAFNSTLQQEVDLDTLSEQVLAVVHETMHPAAVSLWLGPVNRGERAMPTGQTSKPPSIDGS